MILLFINIRMVPREGWKPRASPSIFNASLGTLRMLMNGKSCLIPLLMNIALMGKSETEVSPTI